MVFGQLVIGPPGCGKSTYCKAMKHFLELFGRKCVIVNLDPANESNECEVNVMELISLQDVMEEFDLGPNGGLLYCMEYIELNFSWLEEQLEEKSDCYILFDLPGQVELYTNHKSLVSIIGKLSQKEYRLAAVHLVDAYYATEPSKFISCTFLSLSTMLNLELPHVNVLSKVDLLKQYDDLAFDLEFYTNVVDLRQLVGMIDMKASSDTRPMNDKLDNENYEEKTESSVLEETVDIKRHKRMYERLCELIDDFSLVAFHTLSVQDKESMANLIQTIDRANGFSLSSTIDAALITDEDYIYGNK